MLLGVRTPSLRLLVDLDLLVCKAGPEHSDPHSGHEHLLAASKKLRDAVLLVHCGRECTEVVSKSIARARARAGCCLDVAADQRRAREILEIRERGSRAASVRMSKRQANLDT